MSISAFYDVLTPYYHLVYVIEHRKGGEPVVHSSTATYYAVSIAKLVELMGEAGFTAVRPVDEEFFQPVIVGRKLP